MTGAEVPAELSSLTTFWWGALGALASFLVVMILPEAVKIFRGEKTLAITVPRLLAALVIATIFVFAGGLLAIAFGDATQAKQALAYGLGMEGLLAGSLKAFTGSE